jgi:hypothetical protein
MTLKDPAGARRLLNGDPAAAARVAGEVVAALGGLPFVRSVALFGTLADGTADAWSDVDMLVACGNCGETCWAAAEAIRMAKPVLFYRPFSTVPQPSGRYWFAGESPFHRLDVSFLGIEDYEKQVSDPVLIGHALTIREVELPPNRCLARTVCVAPTPLDISGKEAEIGSWVVRMGNSIKAIMRARTPATPLAVAAEGLGAALDGVARDAVMGGGAIGVVAHQFLDMAQCITDRPSGNHP